MLQAETPLLTGGVRTTRFSPDDVQISSMPFATFKVFLLLAYIFFASDLHDKAKGHNFYVHKELFIGDEGREMLCDLVGVKVTTKIPSTPEINIK